jgi:hypothetical protein
MTHEDICTFFAEQDRALTAIDNTVAATHMKLWASTPAWQKSPEEPSILQVPESTQG